MSGPTSLTDEMATCLGDDFTLMLMKEALQLFMTADPKLARSSANKPAERCETARLYSKSVSVPQIAGDLNDECDAVIGSLHRNYRELFADPEHRANSLSAVAAPRSETGLLSSDPVCLSVFEE